MALMPKDISGRIQFNKNHIAGWTTNAAAIGTTAPEVTALDALTTAAETALAAQQVAQNAAVAATTTLDEAMKAMDASSAGIVAQIRAKAKTGGNGVYALANIPVPAQRRPVTELGTPNEMTASIDQSGGLTLKWKCTNPSGASCVMYQIWRRDVAGTEFTYLGGTGGKEFLDTTIPPGITNLTYQIQAVRSTAVGPWVQFNVNFSTLASGAATATVSVGPTAKLAA